MWLMRIVRSLLYLRIYPPSALGENEDVGKEKIQPNIIESSLSTIPLMKIEPVQSHIPTSNLRVFEEAPYDFIMLD